MKKEGSNWLEGFGGSEDSPFQLFRKLRYALEVRSGRDSNEKKYFKFILRVIRYLSGVNKLADADPTDPAKKIVTAFVAETKVENQSDQRHASSKTPNQILDKIIQLIEKARLSEDDFAKTYEKGKPHDK